MAPDLKNYDYFEVSRASWRNIQKEESRPGGKPEDIDLGEPPSCCMCDAFITRPKPLVCSACKSSVYCSKECSAANWKRGRQAGILPHKFYCPSNAKHMQRVPAVREMVQQFPWGRVEKDGTFDDDVARARFGVLGGKEYGFWSQAGGPKAHLPNPTVVGAPEMKNPLLKMMAAALSATTGPKFQHGYHLLETALPDDLQGWKLAPELVPYLNFEAAGIKPPQIASKISVTDWGSWYEWRGLPKQSPAALLMNFPMSMYQLLVHVLNVADVLDESAADRQKLIVHCLGAELELNFIPLFAELALLLPYSDITLVFYGPAVHDLITEAKKTAPGSLAAKASPSTPVFTYTAPSSNGSSTFKAYIDPGLDDSVGGAGVWPAGQPAMDLYGGLPDAVIGLNAGLLTYPAWGQVVISCMAFEIPFAVTEYTEQSAESQRDAFPKMAEYGLQMMEGMPSAILELLGRTDRTHPIEMNPFAKPGQRAVACFRLPRLSNGFTLKVVGDF